MADNTVNLPFGIRAAAPQQPQPQQQGAPPDDYQALIREALQEFLTEARRPLPQAPQGPQVAAMDPWSAAAATFNPKSAGYFQQRAQALANAQYAGQKAAFEAAVSGKERAMQSLATMLPALQRTNTAQDRLNRPQIKEYIEMGRDGKLYRKRDIVNPMNGEVLNSETLGEAPPTNLVSTQYVDPRGRATVGVLNKGTKQITPATSGGQGVGAIPPAGVVSEIGRSQANLGGLSSVMDAYTEIRGLTQGQSPFGQFIREKGVQNIPFLSATFPEYANYISTRRAALNAYIKSVTGAQFSVAELQRYEGQYPEPWDPEDVAQRKIQVLQDRAVADMQNKLRLYPQVGGSQPQTSPYAGKTLPASAFSKLPPERQQSERQKFEAGGGRVIDGQ